MKTAKAGQSVGTRVLCKQGRGEYGFSRRDARLVLTRPPLGGNKDNHTL